jgi:hypothetical protein
MTLDIKNLVVNGCSYMAGYAAGAGHVDLARKLNIPNAKSLAIGGSANSRIIRTTLKHSYQTANPTFYIMGLTFINRWELPILKEDDYKPSFEGRWCNPQNQEFSDRYDHYWNKSESEKFVEFNRKTAVYGTVDRTEDLMYNVLSAIDSLHARGHRVLVYQQADDSYHSILGTSRVNLFDSTTSIIDGFRWCAIRYQHEKGVTKSKPNNANYIGQQSTPEHIKHPAAGHHHVLNDYLVNYIQNNNIL